MRRLLVQRQLMRWVAAVFWLAGCGADPEPPAPAPRNPIRNVVLISIDALGALHTGAYGYERNTTPNLDRMAAAGTFFRNAYSQQVWTLTSHLTMLNGLYPQSHGASHKRVAAAGATSLAELLSAAGFTTAAFTGVGGYMRPIFGLGRGFDEYEVGHQQPFRDRGERMPWLEAQVQAREANPDHRFFMFVHSYEVHSDVGGDVPYVSPRSFRKRFVPEGQTWERRGDTKLLGKIERAGDVSEKDKQFLTAYYDAGVVFTDERVLAPLLMKLGSLGLLDETLVVITADHGEEIFEHGHASHQYPYEETTRVPLVFHGPGIPIGSTVEPLVGLVDVMPTVLSLLDLPIPSHVQGEDLSPLLRGEELARSTIFVDGIMGGIPTPFRHYPSNVIADIDGERWTYIARVFPGFPKAPERDFQIVGTPELYNLSKDPRQQHDVIEQYPEIATDLRERLLAWYWENDALHGELADSADAAGSKGDPADEGLPILSEGEIEALKALGYVGDEAN